MLSSRIPESEQGDYTSVFSIHIGVGPEQAQTLFINYCPSIIQWSCLLCSAYHQSSHSATLASPQLAWAPVTSANKQKLYKGSPSITIVGVFSSRTSTLLNKPSACKEKPFASMSEQRTRSGRRAGELEAEEH